MEELKGYVDHIIFRNPDNGYTVFVMVCDEELTCVGTFSMLSEGENIRVKGEYTEHPMYGKQFTVQTLEECEPEDEASMERYLGSGAIKESELHWQQELSAFKKDTFHDHRRRTDA